MTDKLAVLNPYDESLIKEIEQASEQEAEQALDTAYKLFTNQDSWLPAYQRIEVLEKLAVLMADKKEELAKIALSEGGKPYTDTMIEVERAINGVKLGIQAFYELQGQEVPMGLTKASMGFFGATLREPRGVVVSLSAFNHPLNLIVHQTIPAIVAGAPVIVKPAPTTPLSCFALVDLMHEAGLPKEWCQAFVCSNELAEKLATDERTSYLSFIGSAKVGWYLRSKLAPGARCALEHGGSAPVIIHESADVDELLSNLVKGGYYHAGQVCVSSQRVFVPSNMLDQFVTKLTEKVKQLNVGDPADQNTQVGPLIAPREVERVASWVEEARTAGAQISCGGEAISKTCYAPTVIVNPPADAKVTTQEIFGPVVCVYSYDDVNAAYTQANSLPYTFQASVFSKDIDFAMQAVRKLKANAVMVNNHTAFRVDWMPFYGREHSGLGVGGIKYSAEEMSAEKLMVIKSSAFA